MVFIVKYSYLQFIYIFDPIFAIILLKSIKGGTLMENFIPFEKLSKKEQRRLNNAKRGTWGGISPVTRRSDNPKAYNRKRMQDWKKELPGLHP